MADAGPPTPAVLTPQAPHIPQQPAKEVKHIPQLNWSHFKPEDAEVYLHRTNNWVDTHQFQEGVKVEIFCLTLVGEARLWYESLRPINVGLARVTISI